MAPQFFSWRLRYIVLYVALFTSLSVVSVKAQGDAVDPKHNSYAVIGAFSVENNAKRLVSMVKSYDMTATVRKNEFRGLYYVYIDQSKDREEIKAKVIALKKEHPQFYDAWAYTGDFTDKPEPKKSVIAKNNSSTKIEEEGEDNTVTDYAGPPFPEGEKEQISKKKAESTSDLEVDDVKDPEASIESGDEVATEETPEKEAFVKKENHYYLYFNTINSKNLKEVKGKVNIIDPERAKQLKEAKSHELVELADPENGTRRVKVATNMFGFREVQYTLDLDDPQSLTENPAVELIGDSIVVNFDLKRFKKGDVLVMYNVYFFKDAAIMQPESIYELNSLLDMLKENENLVVKIHGHTNGNSHGKIIHLNEEDKNFFGINGEHKESFGSAKKLSLYRSYTIQHWLIDQGISENRMEIKGWGGKQMIYDKHSSQAEKNVRVEIEILEE
ncbi:hypothetical protein E1176_06080 [Fulvivirga sp. RKSG066]|uniref:OmpA family protein n=1 Tax=Fulvivirga aurantia TaxID=2529383 RepID=UPI0012BC92ED|nr:OmpA family protein [Fulvivirga aurantia]MTI20582.1 hypothetical protein [Fulvivirga aurantia]